MALSIGGPIAGPDGASMIEVAATLIRGVVRRLGRLSPDSRDPARLFERRAEIEAELRRIARLIDGVRHD